MNNKIKNLKVLTGNIFLIAFLICGSSAFAGELTWHNSRETAFARARSENKMVLLFGGRESCVSCRYMRTQVFETMKPPVKELLEKHYVLWFSDVDRSKEWYSYGAGMRNINLPIICVIDPDSDKKYEDRTTGRQHSPAFYSRLLKYIQK